MEALALFFLVGLIALMYLATVRDRRSSRGEPGGPSCGYGDTTHFAADGGDCSAGTGSSCGGDGGGGDGGGE